MRYFRNLARRPGRTALTILGITIGIWALVVFGSMANKINALVAGGSDLLRRQDHRRATGRLSWAASPARRCPSTTADQSAPSTAWPPSRPP